MGKIYYEGQYFDSETLNRAKIEAENPRAAAYLSKKLGWTTKKTTDESINIGNTKEKSGKTGQTKGDIQQRSGQRIPAKGRKVRK